MPLGGGLRFTGQAMFTGINYTHMFRTLGFWIMALPSVQAELLPTWSPHAMCAEADAIVAGERVGANRVAVQDWLLQPPEGRQAGSILTVTGLEKHG